MVKNWKQASIKNIAKLAGVGTASVDRVLNNRKGVSTNTKTKSALAMLEIETNNEANNNTNIFFIFFFLLLNLLNLLIKLMWNK